jgi:hypothetical protein
LGEGSCGGIWRQLKKTVFFATDRFSRLHTHTHTKETITTETTSSAELLNAGAIYESNSITIDSDVENLVIVIPDSSVSQYGASPSSALFQGFLPANATIVRGTNVTWINADVNVTQASFCLQEKLKEKQQARYLRRPRYPIRMGRATCSMRRENTHLPIRSAE